MIKLTMQLLYTRLLTCKNIAEEMTNLRKRPINPIAIRLGLAEPETANHGVEAGDNPSQHYYAKLLSMTELLFDNGMEAAQFEENLRIMFGTKAFVMFTIDRVVAAIVKQVRPRQYCRADIAATNNCGGYEVAGALGALTA
jgi:paired amphipathic helix protein Sin3a